MKHLWYFFIAFFTGFLAATYIFNDTNPLYIAFFMWFGVLFVLILAYQATKFLNHLFPDTDHEHTN